MNKKFKHGFYGGKYIPFHKGHQYCIKVAAEQCESLTVILFINGDDELKIIEEQENLKINTERLSVESRIKQVRDFIKQFDNVNFAVLDCKKIYETLPDVPKWDAETPFVEASVPGMDAVYSSEPGYDDYFKRAYPYATHILVDPPREIVPISATKIRNMCDEDGEKWL